MRSRISQPRHKLTHIFTFLHSILIPRYWLLIPFLNIIFFWGNNTEDYWTSGLMSRARAQPLSYNPNWISFSHNYKPSPGMGFQGDFFIAVPSSYKQSAICVLGRGTLMFMRGVASSAEFHQFSWTVPECTEAEWKVLGREKGWLKESRDWLFWAMPLWETV